MKNGSQILLIKKVNLFNSNGTMKNEKPSFYLPKKNQFIRWQWDESEYSNTFFEMRIKIDEMTNEVALIITDFCDEGDEEDARMLWDLAIDDLHRVIGR